MPDSMQTYGETAFSLLAFSDYKAWTILPAGRQLPGRFAARVELASSAGLLRYSFNQELSYYAGFAIVTFFSLGVDRENWPVSAVVAVLVGLFSATLFLSPYLGSWFGGGAKDEQTA